VAAISQAKHADLAAFLVATNVVSAGLFWPNQIVPKNRPYVVLPIIPMLESTAIGKLDARTLPLPAPNPKVSKKF
jgi:hypothetical protein